MKYAPDVSRRVFLVAVFAVVSCGVTNAQTQSNTVLYSCRWDKSGASDTKWFAGGSQSALQQFVDRNRQSHRLTHLSGFSHQGPALYCAIMKPSSDRKWAWEERLTRSELNRYVNSTHKGWKLEMFNGYEHAGQVFYTALIRDQPGPNFRWEEQMTQQQVNKFINVTGRGARLTHLYGYTVGGSPRFDAILSSQSATLPWEEKLTQKGLNAYLTKNRNCLLICLNGYRHQGKLHFTTVVDCGRTQTFHGEEAIPFNKLQTLDAEFRRQGFSVTLLNGISQ